MSEPRPSADDTFVEPSWMTATSEAEAASRRLAQATTSLERLSRELASLREWSETVARLDLAHELTRGSDGGALGVLVAMAADPEAAGPIRQAAEILRDRITSALGLEPVGERGEYLSLLPDEVAELDVRGTTGSAEGRRQLFRVARPGWCLDSHIVARPLVEAIDPGKERSHD